MARPRPPRPRREPGRVGVVARPERRRAHEPAARGDHRALHPGAGVDAARGGGQRWVRRRRSRGLHPTPTRHSIGADPPLLAALLLPWRWGTPSGATSVIPSHRTSNPEALWVANLAAPFPSSCPSWWPGGSALRDVGTRDPGVAGRDDRCGHGRRLLRRTPRGSGPHAGPGQAEGLAGAYLRWLSTFVLGRPGGAPWLTIGVGSGGLAGWLAWVWMQRGSGGRAARRLTLLRRALGAPRGARAMLSRLAIHGRPATWRSGRPRRPSASSRPGSSRGHPLPPGEAATPSEGQVTIGSRLRAGCGGVRDPRVTLG